MKTQKDHKSVIRALSTIIAVIMLLCSISVIAGCKNKGNSNNNNSKAEVVLDKVSAAAYKETSVKPQKMAAFNFSEKSTDNSENEPADNSESESESPDVSADIPDYTFIFKSQSTINFDIKLNNPKNYYIMDFKLTCDEEQIEYYDKEMEKWTPINDIWIRWSGSNNQESRYRLRLPNPEISPDKIKISEMYYSDRTDGTNKTAVNMNNKETYTVYKVEDDLVVTETVSNSREKYVFKMAKKDGVEVLSIKGNGVDLAKEGDNYVMPASGKIIIEYQIVNGNVTYKGKCEKEIELFNIKYWIDDYGRLCFIIVGSDLPQYAVIYCYLDENVYCNFTDSNMLFSYSIYPFVIIDDPENPPETKKIYYEKIEIYLSNKLEYNEKHEGLCSIGRTKTKSGRAETDKPN